MSIQHYLMIKLGAANDNGYTGRNAAQIREDNQFFNSDDFRDMQGASDMGLLGKWDKNTGYDVLNPENRSLIDENERNKWKEYEYNRVNSIWNNMNEAEQDHYRDKYNARMEALGYGPDGYRTAVGTLPDPVIPNKDSAKDITTEPTPEPILMDQPVQEEPLEYAPKQWGVTGEPPVKEPTKYVPKQYGMLGEPPVEESPKYNFDNMDYSDAVAYEQKMQELGDAYNRGDLTENEYSNYAGQLHDGYVKWYMNASNDDIKASNDRYDAHKQQQEAANAPPKNTFNYGEVDYSDPRAVETQMKRLDAALESGELSPEEYDKHFDTLYAGYNKNKYNNPAGPPSGVTGVARSDGMTVPQTLADGNVGINDPRYEATVAYLKNQLNLARGDNYGNSLGKTRGKLLRADKYNRARRALNYIQRYGIPGGSGDVSIQYPGFTYNIGANSINKYTR